MKGMNALLLGKADLVSRREKEDLQKRLEDYIQRKGSQFVELKNLPQEWDSVHQVEDVKRGFNSPRPPPSTAS